VARPVPEEACPMAKQAQAAIAILVVVFVLFYIITSPDQAADIAKSGWHGLVNIAHGIGNFLNKLAS
jgi:hypothetical protein